MKLPLTFLCIAAAFCISSCASLKADGTGRTGSGTAPFVPQTAGIELKGNPTTGFTWEYRISDDTIITIDENIEYLGKNGVVGAPSRFTYTVHSQKPGETHIHFVYRRPWETNPPADEKDFTVTVSADGAVTIEETGGAGD